MEKILLFSYNPVPTAQYKTIEGSALRFWRMALELKKKGLRDLTIAVWQKFPQENDQSEGIKITSFDDNLDNLKELTSGYDVVIVSCAMGILSKLIFDAVPKETLIIADAYSPMYVEFLTKSLDKAGDNEWLAQYSAFAEIFNMCLVKSDYLLVANQRQKDFYRGVLAGIGALPSHDDKRFIELPAFVEEDPRVQPKILVSGEKVEFLWFGGVYPWFDIRDLIQAFSDQAIRDTARLTIVGGSNPFYPKDNMRFNGKYLQAIQLVSKLDLSDTISFKDWVEYSERIEIFNNADIAISINNTFLENDYSFRLRVADLAGNGVPVATNGGDPLGERLIHEGVGFRLDTSNLVSLKQSLLGILGDLDKISLAKTRLQQDPLYNELHLRGHIKKLVKVICSTKRNLTTRERSTEYLDAIKQIRELPKEGALPAPVLPTHIDLEYLQHVSTRNLLHVSAARLKKAVKARTHKES